MSESRVDPLELDSSEDPVVVGHLVVAAFLGLLAPPSPRPSPHPDEAWFDTRRFGERGSECVLGDPVLLKLHLLVVPVAEPLSRELPDVR